MKKIKPGSRGSFQPPPPTHAGKRVLTKIDAAVRQLETAIDLWVADGDFVSILTLSYAAHEIIYQINKGHKTPCVSFTDPDPTVWKEVGARAWKTAFKLNYNFSKHGGSNPKELHRYVPKIIPYVILDAISMYNHLGFPPRSLFVTFRAWFILTKPKLFGDKVSDLRISRGLTKELIERGKKSYFDHSNRMPDPFSVKGSPVFGRR